MRGYILNHSKGSIGPNDSIYFWYNKSFIDPNMPVKEFLKKKFMDNEQDGWLHLKVTTQ